MSLSIDHGEDAIFEFESDDPGERRRRRAVPFLLSAVLHVILIYSLFTSHWNYRIFSYQEKTREAFLVPRDSVRFPPGKAEVGDRGAARSPAAVVSKTGSGGGADRAAPRSTDKTKPEETTASAGGVPGAVGPVDGSRDGTPGPARGFKLSYPPEARINLSRPAASIEDQLLPSPTHYRSWTDTDFSQYARQGALLGSTSSGGAGEGPAGIGGGRPGQAGRRARRPAPGGSVALNVPGVDFSAWGETVLNKIQRNWALDPGLGTAWKGEVGVSVLVAKNGDLLAVEIDAPTKIEFLDQAALRAVRSSGPFPALPARYANTSLEVYFVFKYGD